MLSRQEVNTMRHLANAQYWDRPAGGNTGRLFLAFGGPVCADRISNCPLDRVLTYKNLIYLLNLQFYCATIAYHMILNALLVAARNYDQRLRKKTFILGSSLRLSSRDLPLCKHFSLWSPLFYSLWEVFTAFFMSADLSVS